MSFERIFSSEISISLSRFPSPFLSDLSLFLLSCYVFYYSWLLLYLLPIVFVTLSMLPYVFNRGYVIHLTLSHLFISVRLSNRVDVLVTLSLSLSHSCYLKALAIKYLSPLSILTHFVPTLLTLFLKDTRYILVIPLLPFTNTRYPLWTISSLNMLISFSLLIRYIPRVRWSWCAELSRRLEFDSLFRAQGTKVVYEPTVRLVFCRWLLTG